MNDNRERLLKSIPWFVIVHLLYILIFSLVALFETTVITITVSVLGLVYFVIYMSRQMNRNILFLHGWIFLIIITHVGIALGRLLPNQTVIAIGAGVSIGDVLSFTKYGKHTTNAKVMAKTSLMSKLLVYGRSKDGTLLAVKGLGDFLIYSMLIMAVYIYSTSILFFGFACAAILCGSTINLLFIAKMSKRENYKGFPATIIPYCLVLLLIFIFDVVA